MFGHAEAATRAGVAWLRLGIEALGAGVIAFGVLVTAVSLVRRAMAGHRGDFNATRLQLARYLGLALELQLAADILSTAIAPGWDQIGKLAAIATIRTGLNYFLAQEARHEEARQTAHRRSAPGSARDGHS